MIGTVGVMLTLEAECTTTWVFYSFFTDKASIEEVSCIELHTWLVGEHFHENARVGIVYASEWLCDVTFGV